MHTTDDSISTTYRCREYCESWGAIYSFLCMQIVRIAQFPNDDRSVAKAFSIIYAQFNKNSGRIRTPSDSRTAAAPFIFLWLFSECALARLKWMEKNRTRRAKKIHFLLFAFFLFCFIFSRVTRNLMRTYKNTYHLGADILAAFDAENVIKMNTFLFWCVRLVLLLLLLFTFFFLLLGSVWCLRLCCRRTASAYITHGQIQKENIIIHMLCDFIETLFLLHEK